MAVDEAARLRLFEKARESWGEDEAVTLMSSLPRDADQLVTKEYLDMRLAAFEATFLGRFSLLEASLTRRMLMITVSTNATMVGLVLAAVKLG